MSWPRWHGYLDFTLTLGARDLLRAGAEARAPKRWLVIIRNLRIVRES